MADLFNLLAGLFLIFFVTVVIFLLLVVLSNILELNKVNLGVSINDTQVIVDVTRSISNVTTRRKCNVSVACLLLRHL